MSKTTKAVKKHIKLEELAAVAAEKSNGFTVNDLTSAGFPRCTVQRAIDKKVIALMKEPVRSGQRGRPAFRLQTTLKGRTMAKKAAAVAV